MDLPDIDVDSLDRKAIRKSLLFDSRNINVMVKRIIMEATISFHQVNIAIRLELKPLNQSAPYQMSQIYLSFLTHLAHLNFLLYVFSLLNKISSLISIVVC